MVPDDANRSDANALAKETEGVTDRSQSEQAGVVSEQILSHF